MRRSRTRFLVYIKLTTTQTTIISQINQKTSSSIKKILYFVRKYEDLKIEPTIIFRVFYGYLEFFRVYLKLRYYLEKCCTFMNFIRKDQNMDLNFSTYLTRKTRKTRKTIKTRKTKNPANFFF